MTTQTQHAGPGERSKLLRRLRLLAVAIRCDTRLENEWPEWARDVEDAAALLAEDKGGEVSTQWLAEMIMSDCGCSTNNQRLLERIIDRITKYERANTQPQQQAAPDAEWIARREQAAFEAGKQAAQAAVPQGDDSYTAGLESATGHLSRLCDEQRALLVELESVFGVDGHYGPFEDGECPLIDRVREHIAATKFSSAAPGAAPEQACNYPDCKCPTETPCLQGRAAPVEQKETK